LVVEQALNGYPVESERIGEIDGVAVDVDSAAPAVGLGGSSAGFVGVGGEEAADGAVVVALVGVERSRSTALPFCQIRRPPK